MYLFLTSFQFLLLPFCSFYCVLLPQLRQGLQLVQHGGEVEQGAAVDLVCPVLVGVHSVDVVPPITEQDAAGALPVGPVEVAQPDDGALVGVGELEDY